MATTTIRVQMDTIEALREYAWIHRLRNLSDAIDLLICEAAPDIYHEMIAEDDPEE